MAPHVGTAILPIPAIVRLASQGLGVRKTSTTVLQNHAVGGECVWIE